MWKVRAQTLPFKAHGRRRQSKQSEEMFTGAAAHLLCLHIGFRGAHGERLINGPPPTVCRASAWTIP